jgi:hypothetical protein
MDSSLSSPVTQASAAHSSIPFEALRPAGYSDVLSRFEDTFQEALSQPSTCSQPVQIDESDFSDAGTPTVDEVDRFKKLIEEMKNVFYSILTLKTLLKKGSRSFSVQNDGETRVDTEFAEDDFDIELHKKMRNLKGDDETVGTVMETESNSDIEGQNVPDVYPTRASLTLEERRKLVLITLVISVCFERRLLSF